MKTSSISSGFKLILSRAPLMAIAPNFGAEILERLPIKLPMGVLATETITTSLVFIFNNFVHGLSYKTNYFKSNLLGNYRLNF